jgi:hypothetical protein
MKMNSHGENNLFGLTGLTFENLRAGKRAPRVGLLRENTGVPLFLLFLHDSTPRSLSLGSFDDVVSQIIAEQLPFNKHAWETLLPFFEAGGQSAHVVTLRLNENPDEFLSSIIGDDRSFTQRTGIHVITHFFEYADLVVIPQMSSLFADNPDDLQTFAKTLFSFVESTEHFFLILDLPKKVTPTEFAQWKWTCPNAAVYYPWLLRDGAAWGPAPAAAAAFQMTDRKSHINDIPANRNLFSQHFNYDPLCRMQPAELKYILEQRLNVFHSFSDADLRIWGGRTLASPHDVDSRFISTRRTVLAVREAISDLCEPYVLEPLHRDLPKFIDVALQSSFQPHRKAFDSNHKQPFQTNVRLVAHENTDVIEVGVKCFIPFALDEIAFELAVS